MIQMMRFKLSGKRPKALRFTSIDRSHHHQEEDEMAKAGMLAFLLSGWQENRQMITKTLYHSSWPYGLSSLLTDCIKSKHLDQRQKKTTTAKFDSHYTCNPKCFDLTLVLSLQTSAVVFSAEKVHAGKM